jgi:TonB-dependent receptor
MKREKSRMYAIDRWLWAVAFCAAGLSSAHAAVVSGRLTEPPGHRAVKGATIEIVELHRSVVTGSDGGFKFANVAAGDYTLRITVSGKKARSVDKRFALDDDHDFVADVTLTSAAELGSADLDAILVTSSRIPLDAARTAEYEAPNIVSVITADQIRQLPDISAAEAVRRLPGVSAENDTGEARFINIRGLDADLNGTTFAGVRLLPTNPASPLGGGRAVAFDTIPSGLIGTATVTKTNTPEQDAEALGGTIELSPKRLAPGDAPFVSARIGSGYEALRGTKIGDFELSGGRRFSLFNAESQFSAVGSIAYYEDRRGVNDLEESYADNQPATPDKAFSNFQQRYYQNGRKRLGFGGELVFEPSEAHRYYVDAYQMGYIERQFKDYLVFNMLNGGAGATAVSGSPNLINDTIDTYERDLTDHTESLRAQLVSVGGRDRFNAGALDYRVSFTDGSYHVTKDLGPAFIAPANGASITYDNISNPNFPSYTIVGGANRFDPSIYSLDPGFSSSTEYDLDREWSGAVNWTQPLSNWGSAEEYKIGVSGRLRDKVLRPTALIFASVPNATLSPFVTNQFVTYYDNHYSIGYHFNPIAFEAFYSQNFGQPNGFVEDVANTTLLNQQSFQHNKEDVYAAYAQYRVTFGALGLLGGIRVENTHASYAANAFNADTNTLLGLSTNDRVYTNVFPTIQARYEIAPKFIMRGSVSSAVARPGFQQISAAISLTPSTNSISQGNPALRPTTAYNIDWSLEKVFDSGSLISLGLFDKELKNYIVQTTTRIPVSALPPTPIYSGFTSGIVSIDNYRNINQARAAGSEIAWEQRLTQLPGLLRGLGVGANWTWVSSRGDIGRGYVSQLPSTARNTANADLFYDYGPVEFKIAGYYTSRVLFSPSLAALSGAQDVYQDRRILLDVGGSYQATAWANVYVNVKNLTNDPMRYSEGTQNRPIQREYYGTTYQAGVTLKF